MATVTTTNNTAAESIEGFQKWRGVILQGLIFLSVVYGVDCYIAKEYLSSYLQPAEQFCKPPECSSRPDLFAFQMTAEIMQVFMGVTGFWYWHVDPSSRVRRSSKSTPEQRLFGKLQAAERLNAGIFVFQTWDFIFSLIIPEHATAIFLTHHVLAGATAYFSLELSFAHHYAIFFGGCSEISSIFLVFCDFDIYFPSSRGSVWGTFILANQVLFTVLFLWYRIIGWQLVSYALWSDALHVIRKRKLEDFLPGKKSVFLYFFLAMDVLLGLLQIYWFVFGMIPKIAEVLASS